MTKDIPHSAPLRSANAFRHPCKLTSLRSISLPSVSPLQNNYSFHPKYILHSHRHTSIAMPLRMEPSAAARTSQTTEPEAPTTSTESKPTLPPEALDLATRFFNAARTGDLPIFQQAIPAGLPVNLTNDKGDTLVCRSLAPVQISLHPPHPSLSLTLLFPHPLSTYLSFLPLSPPVQNPNHNKTSLTANLPTAPPSDPPKNK